MRRLLALILLAALLAQGLPTRAPACSCGSDCRCADCAVHGRATRHGCCPVQDETPGAACPSCRAREDGPAEPKPAVPVERSGREFVDALLPVAPAPRASLAVTACRAPAVRAVPLLEHSPPDPPPRSRSVA